MLSADRLSQKDILEDFFYGAINNLITYLLPYWPWVLLVIILLVMALFYWTGIRLVDFARKHLGFDSPSQSTNQGTNCTSEHGSIKRLITELPPAAPRNKGARLPARLRSVNRKLDAGELQCVQILCSTHDEAEEVGRIWYTVLENQCIGDHVGWIDYKKYNGNEATLDACLEKELAIYREEARLDVRRSKQLGFFKDSSKHTVLFINILDYNGNDSLERYNNLDGLSIIILSEHRLHGYELYDLR